jgi:glycosyltransferase A (GT-A) superfamily protein (DUF2064 family)
MTSGLASWMRRRSARRMQRAFDRALIGADTPATEQELLALAGRQWMNLSR